MRPGQPSNADELILDLPKALGSYELGLDLNITFYDGSNSDNLVATSGKLTIDRTTYTTISGRIHATYNADNSVDGKFVASLCYQ